MSTQQKSKRGKRGEVTLRHNGVEVATVEGMYYGQFVMHSNSRGHHVTHAPSGLSVSPFWQLNRKEAADYARRLDAAVGDTEIELDGQVVRPGTNGEKLLRDAMKAARLEFAQSRGYC